MRSCNSPTTGSRSFAPLTRDVQKLCFCPPLNQTLGHTRMGQKLPPEQLKFYTDIDEILWSEWDPIGVSTMDWPKDEYHTYLPRVFSIALSTNDPQKIAEYLEWVVVERMELDSEIEHSLEIARKVLSKKKECGL